METIRINENNNYVWPACLYFSSFLTNFCLRLESTVRSIGKSQFLQLINVKEVDKDHHGMTEN